MKVAKLVDVGKFEILNVEDPVIKKSNQVKVMVKAVGVCGTDLHIYKFGRADVQFPRVMGHELSGEVVEIGDKVTKVKVGDRVTLDPVFACGECPTCLDGHPNVCDNVKCFGVQMDGGYQEFIVVDEKHLYSFDNSISFEKSALAEPFSIAANILENTCAKKGDNILIIGSGTIGLALVQSAKSLGANVIISDIVDSKLKKAIQLGADVVVNTKKENLKEAVEKFTKNGVNISIDAVGTVNLFEQSIDLVAPRGRVASIGFDSNKAHISPIDITKKEITIVGSRMNCYQFPKVMRWLKEGKIQADKMVSKTYNINDINLAFEDTLHNSENIIKTLITF